MDMQAVFVVLIAFTVLLVCPLATGYVAERKGYSFLGWASIGLFLGSSGSSSRS